MYAGCIGFQMNVAVPGRDIADPEWHRIDGWKRVKRGGSHCVHQQPSGV